MRKRPVSKLAVDRTLIVRQYRPVSTKNASTHVRTLLADLTPCASLIPITGPGVIVQRTSEEILSSDAKGRNVPTITNARTTWHVGMNAAKILANADYQLFALLTTTDRSVLVHRATLGTHWYHVISNL